MLYLHVMSVCIQRLMDLVLKVKSFDAFKRGGKHPFRMAGIVNVGFNTKQYCLRMNVFAFCSSMKHLKSIYCKQI